MTLASRLFERLGQGAASALAVVHTRLSLAAVEIEEERARITGLLLAAAAAAVFLGLALLLGSLWLVLLFWDSHRIGVLGLLTATYLGIGLLLVETARAQLRAWPALLAQTLQTLHADAAALRGDPPSPPTPTAPPT